MNANTTTDPGSPDTGKLLDSETPESLLTRSDLDREQKIAVLRQWELDLREAMVADDENMPAAEPARISLDQVLQALEQLGTEPAARPVPTTHG
ncbi:MAG: hypothetical protein RQ736_03485 [Thiogranum sp.]|nr:hypothetical protein [Thiogranum sp.]